MTAGGRRTTAWSPRAVGAVGAVADRSVLLGLAALREAILVTLTTPLGLQPVPAFAGVARGAGQTWLTMAAATDPDPAGPVAAAPRPGVVPEPSSPEPSISEPVTPEPDEAAAQTLALVQRAQAGDAEAFGQLYDAYVDLVYRYIYYRVGSQALAEDLTSETFLRALRRITSFTWQGRDIGAWFVTIARNLIADHYKSGRYRLEMQVGDMLDADRATDGPEGEVLEALNNRTLLEAVKKLNPEQQECIVLRFLQGLSVAETALAMGKNDGAIKALQYRAVRTLGRLLPEGFLP